MKAQNRINDFLLTSLKLFGKEISIPSNQAFEIDAIKEDDGTNSFSIQYGFPQTGSIYIEFAWIDELKDFIVNEATVYAPEDNQNIVLASFTPQVEIEETNISANFGLDTNTIKYSGLDEIDASSNAIKMLNIAINDLKHATVLRECQIDVPEGSRQIPCTVSVNEDIKEK